MDVCYGNSVRSSRFLDFAPHADLNLSLFRTFPSVADSVAEACYESPTYVHVTLWCSLVQLQDTMRNYTTSCI
jgi:hypothetical protein